jgi:hypothetical protein
LKKNNKRRKSRIRNVGRTFRERRKIRMAETRRHRSK